MVMSLSEWQIKTPFIAHSGALEQACHRVSRQSCAPAWMKLQRGKNFLKWNPIAFATKQQKMHWRTHQQSLGFEWLVKEVCENDRRAAQWSKWDNKTKTCCSSVKVLWMEQSKTLYVFEICTEYWFSSFELFNFFHLKGRPWSVLTFVVEEPSLREVDWQPRTTVALLKMVRQWRP